MADSPNDFRDPKVTKTESSGGIGKWIAIAVAVLLALLLLSWLFGLFDDDDAELTRIDNDPDAVIVTTD